MVVVVGGEEDDDGVEGVLDKVLGATGVVNSCTRGEVDAGAPLGSFPTPPTPPTPPAPASCICCDLTDICNRKDESWRPQDWLVHRNRDRGLRSANLAGKSSPTLVHQSTLARIGVAKLGLQCSLQAPRGVRQATHMWYRSCGKTVGQKFWGTCMKDTPADSGNTCSWKDFSRKVSNHA
jgi:hypothetical protein